jgi:hypothetical protein
MNNNGMIEDPHFAFPQPAKIERYMFQTPTNFQLMPRLADRSVVIKPVDPIYIPAGQRGTLYQYSIMDCRFVEGQEPI